MNGDTRTLLDALVPALALACSGDLEAYSATSLDGAGVVRIARGDLSEKARYPAAELGFAVPGFSISYAGPQALAVTLVGSRLMAPPAAWQLVGTTLEARAASAMANTQCAT